MKRIILILVVIGCLVAFVGCSANTNEEMQSVAPAYAPMEAADTSASYDSAGGYYEEPAAEEAAYDDVGYTEGETGIGDLPGIDMPDTDRKLVYTSTMTIDSRQFDADYKTIISALEQVGGYVEYEYTYTNTTDFGAARYSSFTLRMPVEQYNHYLNVISDVGTVVDKQIMTEDISDQYYDTDARIEVLEERRQRLMQYLRDAEDMEDIIALEAELSDVLYDLDQLKGSRRGMDQLVDYARIEVYLNEVISAETITSTGDPLGARAANAYNMSLTGVGHFLQNAAIFFAAAAPVLMLLAVIGVIVFVIVKLCRYLSKKRKAKREKERVVNGKTPPAGPAYTQAPPVQHQNGNEKQDGPKQ